MRPRKAWLLLFAIALIGCELPPDSLGPSATRTDDPRLPPWSVVPIEPEWPADEPIPDEFDMVPWLSMPELGRIVVSWRTVLPSTGRVRLGTSADYGQVLVSYDLENLHHLDLGILEPGTAYYYEVSIDDTSATRQGVFVTPGRSRLRFLHFAEMHAPSVSDLASGFADAIRAFRPHLIIESGDMLDNGDSLDHWRAYMRVSAPWISNVILLPAQSNHVTGVDGNTLLRDLFVLPGNERWYPTRFGPIEVLTIDSTFGGHPELELQESAWIRDRVSASNDGDDDPRFIVAAWHYPACSSNYSSRAAERDWVMDNLVDAVQEGGGIDLILTGHDKYYERSLIDGALPHVMSNVALISPSLPGNNHPRCTTLVTDTGTRSLPMFTASPWHLKATVVDDRGGVVDSFTLAYSDRAAAR